MRRLTLPLIVLTLNLVLAIPVCWAGADLRLNSVRAGSGLPLQDSGYSLEVGWLPRFNVDFRNKNLFFNYFPLFWADEVGLKAIVSMHSRISGWFTAADLKLFCSFGLFAGLRLEFNVGAQTRFGRGTGSSGGVELQYDFVGNTHLPNKVYLGFSDTELPGTSDQHVHFGVGFDL